MIEILRSSFRRTFSNIKITHGCICDIQQYIVHITNIVLQQCLHKIIIDCIAIVKHRKHLVTKHLHNFLIGYWYITFCNLPMFHNVIGLYISDCKKKRPQTVFVAIKILKRYILVNLFVNSFSRHQLLNFMLASHRMLSYDFPNQFITACVCPITDQFPLSQIITDRPWIIDIFLAAKNKAVIHCLYLAKFLHILAL